MVYDFTLPLGEAIRHIRSHHTVVYRNKMTSDKSQYLSEISFSPHSVTHIDLPTSMEVDNRNDNSDYLRCIFSDSNVFPCTIVDISDYSYHVKEYYHELQVSLPIEIPEFNSFQENKRSYFIELLKNLRINTHDLFENMDISEQIIVFYTGWNQFINRDKDLSHPIWILNHPYNLHPYLNKEDIDFLISKKIKGIGTDLHSLDIPLQQLWEISGELEDIAFSSSLYGVEDICKKMFSNENIFRIDDINTLIRPVHTTLLPNNKIILEHLKMPYRIFNYFSIGKIDQNFVLGDLAVIPYIDSYENQACLVNAVFLPRIDNV